MKCLRYLVMAILVIATFVFPSCYAAFPVPANQQGKMIILSSQKQFPSFTAPRTTDDNGTGGGLNMAAFVVFLIAAAFTVFGIIYSNLLLMGLTLPIAGIAIILGVFGWNEELGHLGVLAYIGGYLVTLVTLIWFMTLL